MKKKPKQPRKEKVRILYCYNIGIKTQSSTSRENTLNTRYSEMTAFLFAEKKSLLCMKYLNIHQSKS